MKRQLLPFQIVIAVINASIAGIIVVLGELRDELGFSDTGIGIIVAAGFFASFVSQVAFSKFADRGYGRQMATTGIAISAAALFVMVVADDLWTWGLSRAALGFAGGLVLPGLRRAATVLDPANVGENLGRLVIGEILGFVLGPVVAAALVHFGGIRAPFLAFAIGSVAFLPFVARLPADQGKLDAVSRNPLDLFRYRRLQGGLILIFGYFFLIGAFEAVVPVMFTDMGADTTMTGIAFTAFAIPIVVVSTLAGRTADRIGPARVAIAGMGVSAAATTVYGFIPTVWGLTAVMLFVGFADGFGFIAGQVTISRAVPEERQAGALGLMGAAEVLGAGVAAVPAAMLYESSGREITWIAVGGSTLLLLLVGHLRLRGTEPFNTAGLAPDPEPTPTVS